MVNFHCLIEILFLKTRFVEWFIYLSSGHVELLCPERELFLQKI